MNLEKLKEPFAPSEVSWRIGQAGKNRQGIWAKVLAYIDNRCIQDRLDAVVGPTNWKNEFTVGPGGGVLCGVSIKVEGEWITKWDGAENSDIEAVKGGLSDAMKRAAVQWGIGRYLYELGENWATIHENKTEGSHYANCKIKVDGKDEWVNFHWTPPKLPGFATPKQAAPAKAETIEELKEQGRITTADKLPDGSLYQSSLKSLAAYKKVSEVVTFADWVKDQRIAKAFTVEQYADLNSKIADRAVELPTNDKGFEAAEKLLRSMHGELRISEGDYLKLCGLFEDAKEQRLAVGAA